MAGNVTGNFTGTVSTCRRNVDGRGESRDGGGLDPSVLSGSTYRLVETLASPTGDHEPGEVGLCHGGRGIGVPFRKKSRVSTRFGNFSAAVSLQRSDDRSGATDRFPQCLGARLVGIDES